LLGAWGKKLLRPLLNFWLWPIYWFLFLLSALYNGVIDIRGRTLGFPLLFLVTSISGILLIVQIAQFSIKNEILIGRFLQWCGQRSLLLFAIHWPLMQWLSFWLWKMDIQKIVSIKPVLLGFAIFGSKAEIRILTLIFLMMYLGTTLGAVFLLDHLGRALKMKYKL